MTVPRTTWALLLGLALLLSLTTLVEGDIYRYVDKNGVIHFTNVKTDGRYRLYLRASRKAPSVYIKDYEATILEASKRFEVELHLIKAVIKAESNFDHEAVSPKGAKGLMQLMPRTAEDMEVDDALNPEENILGGTRYLSLLLKRFKNDKVLALAAYNAGPDTVESYNGIPPFPETRAFVKRVMAYYRSYRSEK
ncbi:MAG: lytic transglycosylase domain-containing protein [Desulfobacteraceae bacterium]|nr:lytic transglycosylase domain-containing protein [Desulfobacteraceae bacterium]